MSKEMANTSKKEKKIVNDFHNKRYFKHGLEVITTSDSALQFTPIYSKTVKFLSV